MKKTTTFAKASKIISIILVAATMATIFCGCSIIPQKNCNHNYYLSDYTEATTSSAGFKKFTCSDCGNSYLGDYTAPAGHNDRIDRAAPSCTTDGYTVHICEDCGKIEDKPFRWWTVLPVHHNGKAPKRPGYHFRCEECDKKKEGKL